MLQRSRDRPERVASAIQPICRCVKLDLVVVVMNDGFISAAALILFLDDRRSIRFPRLALLYHGRAVPISGPILVRLSDRDTSANWTGLNTDAHFALTKAAANKY